MNHAIKLLKDDHKKVKSLFREYEDLGDHAVKSKEQLSQKIFSELEIHTSIEEDKFYPAADEVLDKEGHKLIAEAFEEHKVVKDLIQQLKQMDPSDEQYDAKMKVMIENVEHHIQEEEEELFPKVEKKLQEVDDELFEEMKAEKESLQISAS